MPQNEALSRLHSELIRGLLEHCACPTNAVLAERLGVTEARLHDLLRQLADIHGVVLHPHVCEPWIVHPFSTTPTLNWIQGETGAWWAPCIWCAFGVAVLTGGSARIHTRLGAESEPLVIDVIDGQPANPDLCVHFAIPPARAWDNVHRHCSLVLPFRSTADVAAWCARYAVGKGEVVPMQAVANLARAWYGSHASPQWRKWTVAEAQEIFSGAGLTSDFWRLGRGVGYF